MNKKEKVSLQKLRDDLECMQETEQEKYDNAPEGLQDSATYEKIQECIDYLQESMDALDYILE